MAFVVFPQVINLLPGLNGLFAVLFFATVFLLAIDSAMALTETVVISLRDRLFKDVRVEWMTLVVLLVIGAFSLMYVRGNGLYLLDIVDHYITSFGIVVIGILEAIVFLGIWKSLSTYNKENSKGWLKHIFGKKYLMFSWIITILALLWILIINLKGGILVYDTYDTAYLWKYGIYVIIGVFGLAFILNVLDTGKKVKD